MASLAALLSAYDFDPGDVIHVDTGTYNLSTNIMSTSDDQGVTIQGPSTGDAILNRGDTGTSKYAVELNNADDVTLEHLALTRGYGRILPPTMRTACTSPTATCMAMPSMGSTRTAPVTWHC